MTKKLSYFFVLYLFVVQPALAGWLRDDARFYQLAGFNAGICIIAYVISAICNCKGTKTEKVEKSEGEKNDIISEITAGNSETKESETVEEEKQEEKSDLKNEKVMKETVSIPKIVQPLTGHNYSKSKKKKDIQYGQWLVLLCTLALAGLITRILREFFGVRSIAIALFLGRIFYLIIGKLADISGFYKAKTLFTNWLYVVLILGGIGYGVYTVQQSENGFNSAFWIDLKNQAVTYVKNRFKGDSAQTQVNTGVVYVFEGTGEILDSSYVLPMSGNENLENEDNAELSGDIESTKTGDNNEVIQTLSDEELKQNVTMGDAIKSLLAKETLSTKTTSTFKYVSKNNELYPYFKTAQEKGMIGTDTDPSKIVSCETYITMKGLYEGRNVGTYAKSEIKTAYWKKAIELGKLNGCEKGKYLTKGNL